MRKYSIVRARANELGGTMMVSALMSTNERGSKFLGSIRQLFTANARKSAWNRDGFALSGHGMKNQSPGSFLAGDQSFIGIPTGW